MKKFYISFLVMVSVHAKTLSMGEVAKQIVMSFGGVAKLIIGCAFVVGIGFGVVTVFKFKQHKDNPQQNTIGNAITMLALSVSLVFLSGFYKPLGYTLFHRGYNLEKASSGIHGAGDIHYEHPDEGVIFF